MAANRHASQRMGPDAWGLTPGIYGLTTHGVRPVGLTPGICAAGARRVGCDPWYLRGWGQTPRV